jgi:membrane protein DedA with SNARE-associated domain
MFKRIFKGYIFLDTIGDAIFTAVVFVVTCVLIYVQELYDNALHLMIAVAIAVAAAVGFVVSIKNVREIASKKLF